MKIAILIPVYNAENFLRECMDSALAAGYRLERAGGSFEVRCCDDGSTDDSSRILNDYAQLDPHVRCVTQANAGVSVTRNRLMDDLPPDIEAFAFLDSDDTVRPEMYATLVEALERTGADVAECEWKGGERVLNDMSVFLLRRTAPGRWINVINKLYRRASVGGIRFREGMAFEEDLFFNFELHQAIRRKVLVPGFFYYYRPNPASATHALNARRYFESTTRRIRLSCEEFLAKGRIPSSLEPAYRAELAKDAYRMCLRKNLKKTKNSSLRRELFLEASVFFQWLQATYGLSYVGLNPLECLILWFCRARCYWLARVVAVFC